MFKERQIFHSPFARKAFLLLCCLAGIALGDHFAVGQQRISSLTPPQPVHKLNLRFYGERPRPLAMVSGDFDEDGVQDLVIGYDVAGGGSIVLLRGNREVFMPQAAAGSHEYIDPFLQQSKPLSVKAQPSLMVSADVNGDGHLDLVYATRGSTQLNVMLGDGKGNFLPPFTTQVPGSITALAAYRPGPPALGEAVIAGFESTGSGKVGLLSFGGGALSINATYALPVAPTMFAVENLDADFIPDTAIVAGGQLLVLHGLNAISGKGQLETLPVNGVEAVAAGDFLFDRNSGVQLFVLTLTGEAVILAHQGFDPRPYTPQQLAQARRNSQRSKRQSTASQQAVGIGNNPWVEVERQSSPALQKLGSDSPILLRSRMSGSGGDDFVVLNSSQRQRVTISHSFSTSPSVGPGLARAEAAPAAPSRIAVSDMASSSVVAAVSMRVNADGRQGLVTLNAGDPLPAITDPAAGRTFYVNTAADNTGTATDPDDGARCTVNAAPSSTVETCTLRDAVVFANDDASDNIIAGQSDTINFTGASGTYSLTWQAGALDNNGNAITHLEILGPVTIIGGTGTIINGNDNDTIFTINPGPFGYYSSLGAASGDFLSFNATLENLTIENGKNQNNPANSATGNFNNVGGCVNWSAGGSGNLTIGNSTVTNCIITWGAGGGIWAWNADGVGSSTLILTGDTISNNSTSEQGGGVYITGGDGTAFLDGGAGGPVALSATNTTLSGNLASITVNSNDPQGGADLGDGGGLFINPRALGSGTPQTTLNGVTVSSNTADGDGGGIYTNSGILLSTSSIENNSATVVSTMGDQYWGGGFYIEVASPEIAATIASTNFLSNSALSSGGGIYVGPDNPSSGTSLQVSLSRIVGNTSASGTTGLDAVSPGKASATENWWGCNAGPGNIGCDGAGSGATTTPRAQFILSATTSTTITLGQSIDLSIALNTDSSGNPISGAFPAVATNYPYAFSVSGVTATLPATGTFDTTGSGTATLTPTSSGGGTVSATFDNQASSVNFSVAPLPQIGSINPNYGAPAALINISGTNFGATQGSGSVTVGGAPSHVVSWSNTAIAIQVPSRATTGNIVVTAGGGSSNGAAFTFYPYPAITDVSPVSGPIGAPVTITGSGLLDGEGHGVVTFNGTPATILSQTSSSIQVDVPAGATTGLVSVRANGVTVKSSSNFTVTRPQIGGINPNYGAPAALINISGTNFGAIQGTGSVTVGGAPSHVVSWSNTAIAIQVPSRATTGNIVVTADGESSNGAAFTFYPYPAIADVSPVSGPIGAPVTITGSGLLDGEGHGVVTFNGTPATILSQTSSSIQVDVPAGAITGSVSVRANGVTVKSSSNFTVTRPQIGGINPNYGAPAALINISGTNFGAIQGTGSVTVGGALSHVVSWSNTAIAIQVPSRATTGNIVVTADGESSNGASFTFYPYPAIADVSPGSGPIGAPVTITGSGLLDGEGHGVVTFNGTPATILSQTSSSIQVDVPAGATTGPVSVRANGVTVKSSSNFTVSPLASARQ